MNNTLSYKDYTAKIEFSADDDLFVGRLTEIKDIVVFHGETVEQLKAAFRDSVDFHIEVCEKTESSGKKVKNKK